MIPLSDDQLRAFAERGYVVIGDVVQRELINAAMLYVDALIEQEPPPPNHRGYHFYWRNALAPSNPLRSLLTDSPAWSIAEFLINPIKLALPQQAQVSLNIPPWPHRPGGPHLDGLTPPEPSGRPGTFTMLAGVFLTDQLSSDMGNLWVWPGSHRVTATYLRRYGPDALLGIAHPPFALDQPEQIIGGAGDLLLAHYLLGHNMGGNLSEFVRRMVYFRLQGQGHASRWRDCVQDPLLEFAPVQAVIGSIP